MQFSWKGSFYIFTQIFQVWPVRILKTLHEDYMSGTEIM